jgi:thymidylate synthase ThyX
MRDYSSIKQIARNTLNLALRDSASEELSRFFYHADKVGVEKGLIEFAARLCYNSTAKLGTAPNFIYNVLKSGHLSVTEHPAVALHFKEMLKESEYKGKHLTSYNTVFTNLTFRNRYIEMYNAYLFGNLRSWIEIINQTGLNMVSFEVILRLLPEAFETTALFPVQAIEVARSQNYFNVPAFDDGSGMKVIMLSANIDMPGRFIGQKYNSAYRYNLARHTWLIEGVSRNLTHQLARHRGASISQESQRYVDSLKHPAFVYPPDATPAQLREMEDFNLLSLERYKNLRDSGMKKEDARFILPSGIATRLIVSFNSKELAHFLRVRCAKDAQWEIRKMAEIMARQANLVFHNVEVEEVVKWMDN